MVQVCAIDGPRPVIAASAVVHPAAVLVGDLIVGPDCRGSPGAPPGLDVSSEKSLYETRGE